MKNLIKSGELKQYLFVIRELTQREIKRKYARSKLGVLWSVLSPLLHMVVMSVIFSYMFSKTIEKYPVYWLTGHLIWDMYSTGTSQGMTALSDNKTLLIRTQYPKQVFVLSRVYTAFVNFLYSLIPYVLVILVFRIKFTWTMLLYVVVVMCTLLFTSGVALILSILNVYFADIKHLYTTVITTVMFYMSAIFYPASSLPPIVKQVVYLNPTFIFIEFSRDVIMYGVIPGIGLWIKMLFISIITFVIGWTIFEKNKNGVIQVL